MFPGNRTMSVTWKWVGSSTRKSITVSEVGRQWRAEPLKLSGAILGGAL